MATADVAALTDAQINSVLSDLSQSINGIKLKLGVTTQEITNIKKIMEEQPDKAKELRPRLDELNTTVGIDTKELTRMIIEFNKWSEPTASPITTPIDASVAKKTPTGNTDQAVSKPKSYSEAAQSKATQLKTPSANHAAGEQLLSTSFMEKNSFNYETPAAAPFAKPSVTFNPVTQTAPCPTTTTDLPTMNDNSQQVTSRGPIISKQPTTGIQSNATSSLRENTTDASVRPKQTQAPVTDYTDNHVTTRGRRDRRRNNNYRYSRRDYNDYHDYHEDYYQPNERIKTRASNAYYPSENNNYPPPPTTNDNHFRLPAPPATRPTDPFNQPLPLFQPRAPQQNQLYQPPAPMTIPAPQTPRELPTHNQQLLINHANTGYYSPSQTTMIQQDLMNTWPYFNTIPNLAQATAQMNVTQPQFADDSSRDGSNTTPPPPKPADNPSSASLPPQTSNVVNIEPNNPVADQPQETDDDPRPPRFRNNAAPNYYNDTTDDDDYNHKQLPCAPYRRNDQDFSLFRARFERTRENSRWSDKNALTNLLHLLQAPVTEQVITSKRISDWTVTTLLDACEKWICKQLSDAQLGSELHNVTYNESENITNLVTRIESIAKRARADVSSQMVERYKYDTFLRCIHPILPMYNYVMKHDKEKTDIRVAMDLVQQYQEEDGGNHKWYMEQRQIKENASSAVTPAIPTPTSSTAEKKECNRSYLNPNNPPPNMWEVLARAYNQISKEREDDKINRRARSGQRKQDWNSNRQSDYRNPSRSRDYNPNSNDYQRQSRRDTTPRRYDARDNSPRRFDQRDNTPRRYDRRDDSSRRYNNYDRSPRRFNYRNESPRRYDSRDYSRRNYSSEYKPRSYDDRDARGYASRDDSRRKSEPNNNKPWNKDREYSQNRQSKASPGQNDKFYLKGKRYRQTNANELITDDEASDREESDPTKYSYENGLPDKPIPLPNNRQSE